MELNYSDRPLLDKVYVYNFYVVDIKDIKTLQDENLLVVVSGKKEEEYIKVNGGCFSYIKIQANQYFDSFTYGKTAQGYIWGEMQFSVPDDGYHNLNCLTIEQYGQRICDAMNFLVERYGIIIDYSHIKFKSVEINKTIVLDDSFEKYQRPLDLLMYLLPRNLRLVKSECHGKNSMPLKATDYKNFTETYTGASGKRGLVVKIYDKKKQLSEEFKIQIYYNYLRFEITLKSPEKIRQALGTNEVSYITGEKLSKYFSSFINTNVIIPYQNHCEKRDITLKKILKTHFKSRSRIWIRNVLLEISDLEISGNVPLILDIDEVIGQLDCIKFNNKQTKYATKNRFREVCDKYLNVYTQGDSQKYTELINKLK